jgi:hypothetical protein
MNFYASVAHNIYASAAQTMNFYASVAHNIYASAAQTMSFYASVAEWFINVYLGGCKINIVSGRDVAKLVFLGLFMMILGRIASL